MSARPADVGSIKVIACNGDAVMVPLYQLAQAYVKAARRPGYGSIGLIQEACAVHFGVTSADMRSPRRNAHTVRARHAAMYLARTLTEYSFPEISRRFGGRDHTTALHAVRKIEYLLENDEGMRTDIELLRAVLAASEVSS